MSLIERPRTVAAPGESRVAFRASWDFFRELTRQLGDQHVLVAFDGEYVELMSPGLPHERYKCLARLFVPALAGVLGLPCFGLGSTLWNNLEAERGLEADEAYYFSREMMEQAAALPEDAEEYPAPDLAIEIDLSRPRVDRPSIYAALGIPEVWRFVENAFRFEQLGPDGRYHPVESSPSLRIRPEELDAWVLGNTLRDDNEVLAEFLDWARRRFGGEA